MKILLYSANFAPELTGVGKYSGEMAAWLAEQGHEVRVVCAPPYYPAWKVSEGYTGSRYSHTVSGRMQIFRAPIWVPAKPDGKSRVLHLLTFAASSAPVMLRQAMWAPDVVISVAPAFVCAPIGWLAARLCGAKSWLHVQDYEVDVAFRVGMLKEGWMSRVVRPIERWLFRRFDRVSSISRSMLQQALVKGVAADRLRLLPNWVDLTAIKPLTAPSSYRQQLGLRDDAIVVLYSGSFGAKHGLMMLPDAARRVAHDPRIVFVICGAGVLRDDLQAACADLKNVHLLPLQPADRLSDLLGLADIHLLPQSEDVEDLVLPSKLAGMVASGRPVVATCRPDTEIARVVSRCGIFVAPADVAAFSQAILALADQADWRAELGAHARAYAEEQLASAKIFSRFEADLQQVIGSGADSTDAVASNPTAIDVTRRTAPTAPVVGRLASGSVHRSWRRRSGGEAARRGVAAAGIPCVGAESLLSAPMPLDGTDR